MTAETKINISKIDFAKSEYLQERVRDRIRESDADYAGEQLDYYSKVFNFHIDAWFNVFATPKVEYDEAREVLDAVRDCPYGYHNDCEQRLTALEKMCDEYDALEGEPSDEVIKTLEDEIEWFASITAKDIQGCYQAWLDYKVSDLEAYWHDFAEEIIAEMAPAGTIDTAVTEDGKLQFTVHYTVEY